MVLILVCRCGTCFRCKSSCSHPPKTTLDERLLLTSQYHVLQGMAASLRNLACWSSSRNPAAQVSMAFFVVPGKRSTLPPESWISMVFMISHWLLLWTMSLSSPTGGSQLAPPGCKEERSNFLAPFWSSPLNFKAFGQSPKRFLSVDADSISSALFFAHAIWGNKTISLGSRISSWCLWPLILSKA